MNEDPTDIIEMVVERAKSVWNWIRSQAIDAYDTVKARGIISDREVQIAAGLLVGVGLLISLTLGIGIAAGYLGYHYLRKDDYVRDALAQVSNEPEAVKAFKIEQ